MVWRLLWCDASVLECWRDFSQRRAMRGDGRVRGVMFSTVVLEERVPAGHLLRALLLPLLFSIRSERQLVEQLEYIPLYRRFVGLDLEASAWHATTFTTNPQRLLDSDIAAHCLARTFATAEQARLLSREHLSVDGTLPEALASQ